MKGVKPGDFTMIMGYPGRTNRYLTSYGINKLVTKDYIGWVDASKICNGCDEEVHGQRHSNQIRLRFSIRFCSKLLEK